MNSTYEILRKSIRPYWYWHTNVSLGSCCSSCDAYERMVDDYHDFILRNFANQTRPNAMYRKNMNNRQSVIKINWYFIKRGFSIYSYTYPTYTFNHAFMHSYAQLLRHGRVYIKTKLKKKYHIHTRIYTRLLDLKVNMQIIIDTQYIQKNKNEKVKKKFQKSKNFNIKPFRLDIATIILLKEWQFVTEP